MGSKERTALTEAMFYVLMSLLHRDMCGTEITEFVQIRTSGRVVLGPGTLYTLLNKFQEEKLIQEVAVSGRKRTTMGVATPQLQDIPRVWLDLSGLLYPLSSCVLSR